MGNEFGDVIFDELVFAVVEIISEDEKKYNISYHYEKKNKTKHVVMSKKLIVHSVKDLCPAWHAVPRAR